ncbi:hypothetical protein [Saccharothrix syringae]|uniref:hypothetical protein n=1 Tax=Saccharothrix syringae TaxID=103733 RepID=UPI001885AAC1|nr:hypothetical protein [Saccharothrix syringae]
MCDGVWPEGRGPSGVRAGGTLEPRSPLLPGVPVQPPLLGRGLGPPPLGEPPCVPGLLGMPPGVG